MKTIFATTKTGDMGWGKELCCSQFEEVEETVLNQESHKQATLAEIRLLVWQKDSETAYTMNSPTAANLLWQGRNEINSFTQPWL